MKKKSRSTRPTSTNRFRSAVRSGAASLSRWTVALALLPCVYAAVRALTRMVPDIGATGVESWWRYAAGAVTYLVLERIVARPMGMYVLGHELTHAVTGLLSGARVHSFKAHSSGGEVRLSKSNVGIALSPYIVPLYAVAVIVFYALARRFWPQPWLAPAFEWVLGMAIAFHLSLTVSAIHRRQSDLKVVGFVLSGVLIVLGNAVVFGLLFVGLFAKTPTMSIYGRNFTADTALAWESGLSLIREEWSDARAPADSKEFAWTH